MKHFFLPKMMLAGAALLLSACSPYQSLRASPGGAAWGDWVSFAGPNAIEISDGVFLDMPDGPYRPRFSDKEGTYYKASNSLGVRSWPGLTVAVQGGFLVRHDQPGLGYPWYGSHIGAPVVRLDVPVPVTLHHPRS